MSTELAEVYYRMALSAANHRNLSRAVILAQTSYELGGGENVAALLRLCRYELGDLRAAPQPELEPILERVQRKDWRGAARLAWSIEHQSVRVLNMQGCIYACAKRYSTAARFFARALEKDHGNQLATDGLVAAVSHRKWRWRLS